MRTGPSYSLIPPVQAHQQSLWTRIGDRLLQEVAKRLLKYVRQEDLVGRLGGNEFIVVFHQLGNVHSAATIAQHVVNAPSHPFEIDTLDLPYRRASASATFHSMAPTWTC
jgi:diguanylate cyclase (GGDEF)-like protein